MVYISKSLGQYNWASSEKQWRLTLHLPKDAPCRAISETFNVDDEPQSEGCPPSEIIEMISARLEGYWVSSHREKYRVNIQWCRDNAAMLDSEWAISEIEQNKKQISRLQEKNSKLERLIIPTDVAA